MRCIPWLLSRTYSWHVLQMKTEKKSPIQGKTTAARGPSCIIAKVPLPFRKALQLKNCEDESLTIAS